MRPLRVTHLQIRPLQFLSVLLFKSRQCLFTIKEDRRAEGGAADDVIGMEGVWCCGRGERGGIKWHGEEEGDEDEQEAKELRAY